jgi:peptide-methionine (S)-S-oxide reductase
MRNNHPVGYMLPVIGTLAALGLGALVGPTLVKAEAPARSMPAPAADITAAGTGLQTAVFAGGCFWGIQAVFQHVGGVTQAVSGYAGGSLADPTYEQVSSGRTGHAESVRVTYDPARVSYGKLLQIFFSVALDPTEISRQGPDSGTQYRSELFVNGPEQERVARAYVAQLSAARLFSRPIATRVDPVAEFYVVEGYHQDYLIRHPNDGYIVINDLPKVHNLQSLFPENWQPKPVTVASITGG